MRSESAPSDDSDVSCRVVADSQPAGPCLRLRLRLRRLRLRRKRTRTAAAATRSAAATNTPSPMPTAEPALSPGAGVAVAVAGEVGVVDDEGVDRLAADTPGSDDAARGVGGGEVVGDDVVLEPAVVPCGPGDWVFDGGWPPVGVAEESCVECDALTSGEVGVCWVEAVEGSEIESDCVGGGDCEGGEDCVGLEVVAVVEIDADVLAASVRHALFAWPGGIMEEPSSSSESQSESESPESSSSWARTGRTTARERAKRKGNV